MSALPAVAETSPRPLRQGHVLADLLKQEVPKAPVPPVELRTTISDYEILNDQSYFMVGFYTLHPDT